MFTEKQVNNLDTQSTKHLCIFIIITVSAIQSFKLSLQLVLN